jgi:hypothetical protein
MIPPLVLARATGPAVFRLSPDTFTIVSIVAVPWTVCHHRDPLRGRVDPDGPGMARPTHPCEPV